ncbi:hypothetical protein SLEP1_g32530 [Rubroshorea leprosula]|uniref:Uncharacterized protein n=1 Tax=Rubroshorea leprosula TaxID=152421 RepID=A0AAV5KDK6_9ROSI|nr:hypothetical protein SLEP1_g32530 [Rubroshorea leprosula]
MRNLLMLLVKEAFGDDEMEMFFNILWKKDGTAKRTSLLKPVFLEFLEFTTILGGNALFYLCETSIPLSFDSLVIRSVVRWTAVHVMKYCFISWVGSEKGY